MLIFAANIFAMISVTKTLSQRGKALIQF